MKKYYYLANGKIILAMLIMIVAGIRLYNKIKIS